MREVYSKNLILGYLNISSLRYKIIGLSKNYQFLSFRRERNSKGHGKTVCANIIFFANLKKVKEF